MSSVVHEAAQPAHRGAQLTGQGWAGHVEPAARFSVAVYHHPRAGPSSRETRCRAALPCAAAVGLARRAVSPLPRRLLAFQGQGDLRGERSSRSRCAAGLSARSPAAAFTPRIPTVRSPAISGSRTPRACRQGVGENVGGLAIGRKRPGVRTALPLLVPNVGRWPDGRCQPSGLGGFFREDCHYTRAEEFPESGPWALRSTSSPDRATAMARSGVKGGGALLRAAVPGAPGAAAGRSGGRWY